jgi:ATP-dependent Lhr-like helicase
MGRTGRRSGTTRNCLFLTTDNEELLTALAISLLWREGIVEPVLPPLLPPHIYAQQVMALTLQEGGITRPDWDTWLADAAACVPPEVRDAVLRHMLSVGS